MLSFDKFEIFAGETRFPRRPSSKATINRYSRPRLIKLATFPKSIIAGSISRFPRPATNRNAAPRKRKCILLVSRTVPRRSIDRSSRGYLFPANYRPRNSCSHGGRAWFSIIYACLSRIRRSNSFRFSPISGINFIRIGIRVLRINDRIVNFVVFRKLVQTKVIRLN